jgi:hypothetical protein
MRISTLLVILILAAAGIFAYQNEPLLRQIHTIALPGGALPVPLVGVLLTALAAGVVLMWLIDAADTAAASAGRRRAEARLAEREREMADLKTRVYEETARKIDDLSRKLDERLEKEQEQTTVWRRTGS